MALTDKSIHEIRTQPNLVEMPSRLLDLGEHIFDSKRGTVRIDVGVPTSCVEKRDHFLRSVRHDKRMNFTRWLADIVARMRGPIMFKIAPAAAQREGMHRSAMSMTREDTRLADAKDIYKVPRVHVKKKRLEVDSIRLWNPLILAAFEIERICNVDFAFHTSRLRRLVGNPRPVGRLNNCAKDFRVHDFPELKWFRRL